MILRPPLSTLPVTLFPHTTPFRSARDVAAELDELGYGALWVPEAVGREAISHAAVLLSATERIVVATGVANLYNRTPTAARSEEHTCELQSLMRLSYAVLCLKTKN